MKTVQDWLRESNIEELIGTLLSHNHSRRIGVQSLLPETRGIEGSETSGERITVNPCEKPVILI